MHIAYWTRSIRNNKVVGTGMICKAGYFKVENFILCVIELGFCFVVRLKVAPTFVCLRFTINDVARAAKAAICCTGSGKFCSHWRSFAGVFTD